MPLPDSARGVREHQRLSFLPRLQHQGVGHLRMVSSGQGRDLSRVTHRDCGRRACGSALHPRLPFAEHWLCAGYSGALTCAVLLVPLLPILPLSPGSLSLVFPELLTSLFRELSLSPCLLGHSPDSGPLPEALEHPVGVFVRALLTLCDVQPRCSLVGCFPTGL